MTQPVPPAFWQGVEQFNQRQFYDCHDTLEAIWIEAIGPEKNFYQGILQIAVALYHLGNHNWQGAVTLLGEGIYRLRAYQPSYASIDVARLIGESNQLLMLLQQTGPAQVAEVSTQVLQNRQERSDTVQIVLPTLTISASPEP